MLKPQDICTAGESSQASQHTHKKKKPRIKYQAQAIGIYITFYIYTHEIYNELFYTFKPVRKLKCPAPKGRWKQQDAAKLQPELTSRLWLILPLIDWLVVTKWQRHEWQNHRMLFSHRAFTRRWLRSSRWALANIRSQMHTQWFHSQSSHTLEVLRLCCLSKVKGHDI